jgi:hypothetical protein
MLVYQRVRVESGRFFWIQTWRRDSMCTTADLLVYDTAKKFWIARRGLVT